MVPSEALNKLPTCDQLPWLTVAVVNVNPAGTASVTTTELAAFGPRFVTVRVKVTLLERFMSAGETELLSAKSVVMPEQQTMLLMPMESMYQPTLDTPLSVPTDQRNCTVWPEADAGRFTTVLMNPPELPLHASRLLNELWYAPLTVLL